MASPRQNMERILAAVVMGASLAFIVATNWLPWASSDLGAVRYTAGGLAPFMTGIAIAVIAATAATLRRDSKAADWLLIGLSTSAVVMAIYLALHSISSANASPFGNTTYRAGSGLGVLAALVMLAATSARLAVVANDVAVRSAMQR